MTNTVFFRYQGKELQPDLGMQLYDFHARQYDPQIGRFWGIDPADQFPSGYTGIGNDPANLTDPTGMQAGGVASAAPGMETSADAEARKKYVSRGAEKFQLYVDGQFAGLVNWENAPHVGIGVPAVALMQGVSFATRNVGGNVMHGYWMDANYTDYTRQGLARIDGKFTQMGEPVVFNKFIAFSGAQSGGGWMDGFGKWNTGLGFGFTALENIPGSFRFATTKLGFNPKYYANAWKGNQYAKTFNIGKIGKGLGYLGAGVGTLVDGVGVRNYYYYGSNNPNAVHPAKAGLNAAMAAYGIWVNPIVGTAYGAIDVFYPNGWGGAMQMNSSLIDENQGILGPRFNLYKDY